MSASVNPITGPTDPTTALMAAVISYQQICCHFLPLLKLDIVVYPVSTLHQRYATQRHIPATGHPWGCPVRLCPIYYPLTPFFWFVDRRLTEST